MQLPKLDADLLWGYEYEITSWTEKNRIIQLEGTYNNHLVQLPDHFRADQKLKHIIKGTAQMPLKH